MDGSRDDTGAPGPGIGDGWIDGLPPSAGKTSPKWSGQSNPGVVFPRLLIGWVVLICAEVFSGASLGVGLWHPWTLIVTYWLYFAHFFFTTLATRTGRTSLSSLYLWGVLFGLYESWITKVIWSGYAADGKFAMGRIGPYGFSEISMVFIFHPVVSFLLPLTAACILCPPLRRLFPDLAWFTSQGNWAQVARVYMIVSFGIVMGMNSGGPVNLAKNVALMLAVLLILSWLARPGLAVPDGRPIMDFGRWGFAGLCLYLALLYGVMYVKLRPEALPSVRVQLLTFVFYAVAIAGLWRHRRRETLPEKAVAVDGREWKTVLTCFALVFGLGFLVALLPRGPIVSIPFLLIIAVWPVAGFLLTGVALWAGTGESPDPLTDLQ
jgi:hypothetical protein